jgi:hypothetical protein
MKPDRVSQPIDNATSTRAIFAPVAARRMFRLVMILLLRRVHVRKDPKKSSSIRARRPESRSDVSGAQLERPIDDFSIALTEERGMRSFGVVHSEPGIRILGGEVNFVTPGFRFPFYAAKRTLFNHMLRYREFSRYSFRATALLCSVSCELYRRVTVFLRAAWRIGSQVPGTRSSSAKYLLRNSSHFAGS